MPNKGKNTINLVMKWIGCVVPEVLCHHSLISSKLRTLVARVMAEHVVRLAGKLHHSAVLDEYDIEMPENINEHPCDELSHCIG